MPFSLESNQTGSRDNDGYGIHAAVLLHGVPGDPHTVTYRLYQICDEKKMMEQAKHYNTLATSWGLVADRSQKSDEDFRQSGLDEY